jgi:hypothetical protein
MVGRVILNAPRVVLRRFDKDIEPYQNTYRDTGDGRALFILELPTAVEECVEQTDNKTTADVVT